MISVNARVEVDHKELGGSLRLVLDAHRGEYKTMGPGEFSAFIVGEIMRDVNRVANAAFAAGRRFESATEGLSDETFEVTK